MKSQLKKIFIGLTLLITVVIAAALIANHYLPTANAPVTHKKYMAKTSGKKATAKSPAIPSRPHKKKITIKKKTPLVQKHKLPTFEVYPEEKPFVEEPTETLPVYHDKKPRIAIIFDDMGYDMEVADQLIGLDAALTFSMLPFGPFQQAISEKAHARNREIMLHLPMEPHQYPKIDPGPGALLTSMTPNQITWQLSEDLQEVPYAKGVNNHMGSKMTERSDQMRQIFITLKKEGFYFVDSRTTKDSRCKPSADLLQLPFAQRDVFLDHIQTEEAVHKQIKRLIHKALKNGTALGIGHPHPLTYKVLKAELGYIKDNVEIVPASELIKISG